MISRREFVAAACALCAGCASRQEPAPAEPARVEAKPPQPALVDKPAGIQGRAALPGSGEPVLIWRERERYYAVSGVCTHEGGELFYNEELGVVECASHGSRFYVDGAVAGGPAERAIEVYDVKTVEGRLEIRRRSE